MFISPLGRAAILGRPSTDNIGKRSFATINAIGDSYTFGVGASDAAHQYINIFATHFGATLTNTAISGTVLQNSETGSGPHTNNGRDRYETAMCGTTGKKQLAVIAYGFNDARGTLAPATFNVAGYQNDFIEMINGLFAGGYTRDTILIISPWWITDAGLLDGSAGFTGQTRSGFEAFVTAAHDVAQMFGLWYCDAYAGGRDQHVNTHISDDIHTNDAGHAIYAQIALSATQFPVVAVPDLIMLDNFTDTDGVDLTAHIADSGMAWESKIGTAPKIQSNQIWSTSANAIHNNMAGPRKGADYYVEAVMTIASVLASDNVGFVGRVDPAGGNYYCVRYSRSTNDWSLFKSVASVLTTIGTNFAQTWTTGTRTVRLVMQGSNISVLVDGVTVITATDSAVTTPGFVGTRLAKVASSTTGIHIDSLTASY